jgi:cell division cycle protein 37
MSKLAFDYSKWDNIEISDDEADTHPNIDKASWFRMKHRSRVEREETEQMEKTAMEKENKADGEREREIVRLLAEVRSGGDAAEYEDEDALVGELEEVRGRVKDRLDKIDFMEKNKKWNVDNLSHTATDRTILSGKGSSKEDLVGGMMSGTKSNKDGPVGPQSEKAAVNAYADFVDKHEQVLEDYLATTELEDCKKKLHEHGGTLLHEHAQSYILLSCLEDEMNGFPDKMKLASRNSQVLSHVTDLAASLNRHPRDVVLPFFSRIEDPRYRAGFEEAVRDFIVKIQKRAVDKRKEMDANEPVELSREERLGPGGLDPVEVFETLPESMQEAFEQKDTQMLQVALEAMEPDEAKRHMDACEASGLWVQNNSSEEATVVDDGLA